MQTTEYEPSVVEQLSLLLTAIQQGQPAACDTSSGLSGCLTMSSVLSMTHARTSWAPVVGEPSITAVSCWPPLAPACWFELFRVPLQRTNTPCASELHCICQ